MYRNCWDAKNFQYAPIMKKFQWLDRFYYYDFLFPFTFVVFHPTFGYAPAYKSDNHDAGVVQYPIVSIYFNDDRYYGIKSAQVREKMVSLLFLDYEQKNLFRFLAMKNIV